MASHADNPESIPTAGGFEFDLADVPSCDPATVRRWLEVIDEVPEDNRPPPPMIEQACANERRLLTELQKDQPGCIVLAGPAEMATGQNLYADNKQIARASRQLRRELLIHHRDDAATGFIAAPRQGLCVGSAGDLQLPLTAAAAALLYEALEPAMLGVEGKGDVLDKSKRKSRDLPCDAPGVVLPPSLQKLPSEALEALRPVLAPGWERLDAMPYKIVAYQSGDFFRRHVDASSEKDHVGTLTLHLPCVEDLESHTTASVRALTVADPAAGAAPEKFAVVPADFATPASGIRKRGRTAGDDDEALAQTALDNEEGTVSRPSMGPFGTEGTALLSRTASMADSSRVGKVERLVGGELLLYTGRDSAHPSLLRNADTEENEWAYAPARFGRLSSSELVVQLAEYRGAPHMHDTSVPCKFAAWLKDVPHEVRPLGGDPVEAGSPPLPGTKHRVVVTYKLYARGAVVPMALPRRRQLAGLVDDMFVTIAAASTAKFAELPDGDDTAAREELAGEHDSDDDEYNEAITVGLTPTKHHGRRFLPRRVGILLHHCYAPAELSPRSLRGIDAAMYRTLRAERRCFVVPAFWRRSDYIGTPFKLTTQPARFVLAGANPRVKEEGDFPLSWVESTTSAAYFLPQNPVFAGVAWVAVGHGSYVNGGACYGNCDCETDWYYRGAALIVCPERSLARWAWAISKRGSPAWRKAVSEAVTLRTLCDFLG